MNEKPVEVKAEVVNENAPPRQIADASIIDTVVELAVAWATYGLETGKRALEQSASTLEKTAQMLDSVSKSLAEEKRAGEAQNVR